MKDKKGNDVKVGSLVLVPCRVVKLGGSRAPLVHIETVDAYGHENPNVTGGLKGRTKTAFWAEPEQLEVFEAKAE
jgi:hypothetical protein